ncbi:WPP domain-interacting protein 2 [Diospyros lotus]|uniref:WPP domain-interacting protein 2 n=1 Tax=Diospyros lotus TaxID=55363 RepID=UPI00225BFBB6|nr:WPP domain-interacting protein 2 [Diospyros lotus]XP_052207304.1 WPP domain-interacting protein 2 [Diospyros lotus]
MDLESECSALESVEENENVTPERNKIENNGLLVGEYGDDKLLIDTKLEDVGVTESVSSPPFIDKSPAGSVGTSPPATTKGYGLKKWRRIKREVVKDGSSSVDTSKILKRGLSTSAVNSGKPQGFSGETRPKSDGSLSSTDAVLKSLGVAGDGFALYGSSIDSGFAVGPSFAAGADSENSEDRSSKSSTAASAPKLRHEMAAMVGYARDKNRIKNSNAKNLVNPVQRGQQGKQGKSRTETSKKPRGDRVKIEKENSHSSMESDSRSSNFVFMQGANSVTSNGRQSARSTNYDGENSDEAQGGEEHLSVELQAGYRKENVAELEDLSQEDLAAESWEVKEEKVENHRSSTDQDPLVESIHSLQSVQEELEKELQKLREIGAEHDSLFNDSTRGNSLPSEFASFDSKIPEAGLSDLLPSGGIAQSYLHPLETEDVSLKANVNPLEGLLEEANTMLKVKDDKIVELEDALRSNEPLYEMESDFEGLFKQKIEAEVEYLVISTAILKLRVSAVDEATHFEKQNTIASEQARMLNELGDVESKAAMLKRQAVKLETYCNDMEGTDQVLKLQKKVCKEGSYFFMQLILLLVVFAYCFLQLSPHSAGFVPT